MHIQLVFTNNPNTLSWFLNGNAQVKLPRDLRPLVQVAVPAYSHSATASGQPTDRRRAVARAAPTRPQRHLNPGLREGEGHRRFQLRPRHAYGIDRLGSGAGASVAILNAGEDAPAEDVAANARCFGFPKLRSRTLFTDGQTTAFGRGTFEPEEDLALVRGMAPGLTSLTLSKTWLAAELWFLGASQVLDSPPLPDSFSISYGECERDIRGQGSTASTRAGAALMNSLLIRLGLAGVGSYASAGDFGSTCNGRPFSGSPGPRPRRSSPPSAAPS